MKTQKEKFVDLILDDFLKEMVYELTRIEKIKGVKYRQTEEEIVAQNILLAVADYHAEEHLLETKLKQQKRRGLGFVKEISELQSKID